MASTQSSHATPYWHRFTALDLRSLALFRLALGLALIGTLLSLFTAVPLWFGDAGLLPRSAGLTLPGFASHNLTLITGNVWALRGLLLLALLAALAVVVGYRTRTSLLIATLLLFSFVTRNPLASLPHELLLVGIGLWSLPLPLAMRWSLDATLAQTHDAAVSDVRRGGLIGLMWSLQWLWLALAALLGLVDSPHLLSLLATGMLLAAIALRAVLLPGSALRWISPLLAAIGVPLLLSLRGAPPLVAVFALMALLPWLPTALWAVLQRRHARRPPVQIFYDGECRFCHRACRVLQDMLILPPQSKVMRAQDHPRALALMKAQNTWVVIDHEGRATLHWLAGVTLVQHSAWLRWLAPLLALPPIRQAGDLLYKQVVRHRGLIGSLLGRLAAPNAPAPASGLALMLITLQCLVPIQSPTALSATSQGFAFTAFITPPAMPTPGQWIAAVEETPGQFRDALRDHQRLAYTLAPPTGRYADPRWQQYLQSLGAGHPASSARRFADRFCGDSTRAPQSVRLEWIVSASGSAGRTERQRSERFRCVNGEARPLPLSVDREPVTDDGLAGE